VTVEDKAVVVFIPVWVVAVDFHNFGNEAPARPSLQVHDDIYGITDVCLDRAIWKIDATLQHATRESRKALPCGSGVQGRKAPGMPGIEELQEIEGLSSAYFAEDDPVGPVAKGGFEEVPDGDSRETVLRLPRLETDQVVLVHVNFGRVFDEEDTLIRRDELSEDIEHCSFPRSGTPSDENVFPSENVVFELVGEPPLQRSCPDKVFDAKVLRIEFPDGQSHAVHTARWDDGGDAAAIREP